MSSRSNLDLGLGAGAFWAQELVRAAVWACQWCELYDSWHELKGEMGQKHNAAR